MKKMSKLKENFNIDNSMSQTYRPNINSIKEYSLKELKTSHNGLVCINYNSEYLRERLCKLKEECNFLKQKLNLIENLNLKEKNNLEKIIINLREENHTLKQNLSSQKIALNNYLNEKEKIIKDLKEVKQINNELNKEKSILLERIKESNNLINNNITPKLKTNEDALNFLQNKIDQMQKIIINLKNDKIRIMNDNNNKNEMIKILTTQNKKLLKEIKMKYNKDLNFIQDIEKFGIETNMSNNEIYEEMKSRYENNKNDENEKENDLNIKNKKINNLKNIKKLNKTDINE